MPRLTSCSRGRLKTGLHHEDCVFDPRADALTVILRDEAQVAESDENKPGVILDYDGECDLVSIEIIDASRRVTDTRKIEFEVPE